MWKLFASSGAKSNRIYLDHASATPVLPEAARAVAAAEKTFGNPGSIHAEGVAAAHLLKASREKIAKEIGCKARELIFTSGGTEGNNLAILGFARQLQRSDLGSNQDPTFVNPLSRTHWIVSAIEHPSVHECFGEIERLGGTVSFADPGKDGIVRPEAVANLLRPETVFISIGWGNGEIGVIQPLARIARVLRAHEEKHQSTVIFHSDAGQAPLYEAAHVNSLGVDMLVYGSGKMYGPRGIGALYLNDRVALAATNLGGKQERGLRAGTEEVALAAGFAEAFVVVAKERTEESKRLRKLRDDFAKEVARRIPGVIENGNPSQSLPHILNISIPDINSEYLTLALDHAGIALSTKSACREGEEQRSHVVEALGGDEWRSRNTLRFSFGRATSENDLKKTLESLVNLVQRT